MVKISIIESFRGAAAPVSRDAIRQTRSRTRPGGPGGAPCRTARGTSPDTPSHMSPLRKILEIRGEGGDDRGGGPCSLCHPRRAGGEARAAEPGRRGPGKPGNRPGQSRPAIRRAKD